NSILIRSLIDAKPSYREVARIAKCSHGSVHAELVTYRKEKEAADRLKLEQLQESIKADSNNQSLDEMKKMNVSQEAIQKVETSLQEEAKSKVTEIQGQYYETFD
ncbi:MAG: hypothetical protein JNM24_08260, partial [Bdellovibrionaceae bacterium]|nr:hypothetical protein [Pseudobdellovibrionaceae bacterium]